MSTTAADFPNGTSPSADTSALPTPAANPLAASTSSAHAPPPPEIDVTFQRLSAYRNVRGVMVLARSAWSTATPAAGAVSAASGTSGIVQSSGTVFEGESGRRYAGALEAVVNATAGAVAACDEGDELRFMRIRTKRHELIISGDERYLLVVLQDPQ